METSCKPCHKHISNAAFEGQWIPSKVWNLHREVAWFCSVHGKAPTNLCLHSRPVDFLHYFFPPQTSVSLLLCHCLKYKTHKELLHLNPLRNILLLHSELLNPWGPPQPAPVLSFALTVTVPKVPGVPGQEVPPGASGKQHPDPHRSTQPMFVHYSFPFGCCLCSVSSSPLIQEAGASNLILHIQFSALPATTTNVLSQKERKKKKRHRKLLQSNLCSTSPRWDYFSFFLFFFFWEKTEGKINKFLQLNKHTECYSSRQSR